MKKFLIAFMFIFSTSVFANECYYKTETMVENGKILSTKETKICEETIPLKKEGFWNSLSKENKQLLFQAIIVSAYVFGG